MMTYMSLISGSTWRTEPTPATCSWPHAQSTQWDTGLSLSCIHTHMPTSKSSFLRGWGLGDGSVGKQLWENENLSLDTLHLFKKLSLAEDIKPRRQLDLRALLASQWVPGSTKRPYLKQSGEQQRKTLDLNLRPLHASSIWVFTYMHTDIYATYIHKKLKEKHF